MIVAPVRVESHESRIHYVAQEHNNLPYTCHLTPLLMPFAGYNEVVRIPSGATNIDVRQHSYSGKPEDDNYLGKTFNILFKRKLLIFSFPLAEFPAIIKRCVHGSLYFVLHFCFLLVYVNDGIKSCTENLRRWHI